MVTFESAKRETQALHPIKTPADILARLPDFQTEAEREAEKAEGDVSVRWKCVDPLILTPCLYIRQVCGAVWTQLPRWDFK